ncbi:MAG: hypothetical protein COB42_07075 [Sulfurimonas sp.]|nr:MAG: hypothetical protein COB42_07075 [Sulfurimonas sp.]
MTLTKSLLILSLTFFIAGCTSKTPFTSQAPLEDAALVYFYVANTQSSMDASMEDSKYKTRINGKNVAGTIEAGEYKVFDMKPATVLFTSVRRNIEQKFLKLHLEAGQTYYLKVQSGSFGGAYSFEEVSASEASEDLKQSSLSGSFELDMAAYVPDFGGSTAGKDIDENKIPAMTEAEIDAIIEKKLKAMGASAPAAVTQPSVKQVTSSSKLVDIREAYEMKKQGLLTNEEFKIMKAEILAK